MIQNNRTNQNCGSSLESICWTVRLIARLKKFSFTFPNGPKLQIWFYEFGISRSFSVLFISGYCPPVKGGNHNWKVRLFQFACLLGNSSFSIFVCQWNLEVKVIRFFLPFKNPHLHNRIFLLLFFNARLLSSITYTIYILRFSI